MVMEILRICQEEQLLIKYYVIKCLILLKIQIIMVIKEVLLQWFINFLIKCPYVLLLKARLFQTSILAEELHQIIIRKFEKRKVYLCFIDNIWGADLVDMQLISKFNNVIRFLSCVIDIFSKYASDFPWKDKIGITITNVFQKLLDVFERKSIKIWVHKRSEFDNRLMKSWCRIII